MDGVVLVDFEEEALRRFLEHEVASGIVKTSEVDAELERFKQDIISVAEYYDEKDLLTVVMGDQDMEEIIDDLILAVDKVIETRKNIVDEDAMDGKKGSRECESPCNALIPSPDKLDRPSTVEIREATEEDIKSFEEEAKKVKANENTDEEIVEVLIKDNEELGTQNATPNISQDKTGHENVESEKLEAKTEEDNASVKLQTLEIEAAEMREKDTNEEIENTEIADGIEKVNSDGIENTTGKAEDGSEPVQSEHDQISQKSQAHMENDMISKTKDSEKSEKSDNESGKEESKEDGKEVQKEHIEELQTKEPNIPLVFSSDTINVDYDEIKNLIANDLEMCFIDFYELMRNDGSSDDKFDNEEALTMLSGILKQDSVSYSNGFFIFKFPFSLLNENFINQILKLGNVNLVCRVRENTPDSASESKNTQEEKFLNSLTNERIRIIFVTEVNMIEELRTTLEEIINNKNLANENLSEKGNIEELINSKCDNRQDSKQLVEGMENKLEESEKKAEENMPKSEQNEDDKDVIQENEIMTDDKTEDSTGKDIEDLISDDTLNEGLKLPESLKTDENQDINPDEKEVDDTHSQASTIASVGDETQRERAVLERERAVLERQCGLEIEADNVSLHPQNGVTKASLIRQGTYSASEEMKCEGKIELLEDTTDHGNDNNDDIVQDGNKDEIQSSDKNLAAENDAKESNSQDPEKEENETNKEEDIDAEKNNSQKEHIKNDENKSETVENEENKTETVENEENKTETVENEENKTETVENADNKAENGVDKAETMENEDNKIETVQNETETAVDEDKLENEENKTETTENEEIKETENAENEDNKTENEENKTEHTENEDNKTETAVNEENKEAETVKDEKNEETENAESESKEQETVKNEGNNETTAVENEEIKEIDAVEKNETECEENENNDMETVESEDKGIETVESENKDIENEESENKDIENEENKDAENKETANEEDDNKNTETVESEENKEAENEENKNVENEHNTDAETEENEEKKDEENLKIETSGINETGENADIDGKSIQDDDAILHSENPNNTEKQISEDMNDSHVEEIEIQKDKIDENLNEVQSTEENAVENISENESKNIADSEKHGESPDTKIEVNHQIENIDQQIGNLKENIDENDTSQRNEVKSEEQNTEEESKQEPSLLVKGEEPVLEQNSDLQINKTDAHKVMDNDSDSNDENITIETKAEIHAVDCVTPPTAEVEKPDSESINIGENEEAEVVKSDLSNNNPNNTEQNKLGNEINNEKVFGNDEDRVSDSVSIKDIDSLGGERFSGKRQERNGSGILDESRQQDGRESEEPQERSSSSSRGEL